GGNQIAPLLLQAPVAPRLEIGAQSSGGGGVSPCGRREAATGHPHHVSARASRRRAPANREPRRVRPSHPDCLGRRRATLGWTFRGTGSRSCTSLRSEATRV